MSLGTTIKTIQDIMRKDAGVDGDAQRISQLVWMIFLKVLDDLESQKEMMEDGYKCNTSPEHVLRRRVAGVRCVYEIRFEVDCSNFS